MNLAQDWGERVALARTVLLALAASAAFVLCARAADLPGAPAAEIAYARTCNIGGMAGFVIPGTDTCLKISGGVSSQFASGSLSRQYGLAFAGSPGAAPVTMVETASAGARDATGFTAQGQVNFEARDITDAGLLRAYVEIVGVSAQGFDAVASTTYANVAYVQWAGLTAGRAASFFSYLGGGPAWSDFYSPNSPTEAEPDMLAYTATFGSGWATIAIQDATGANIDGGLNGYGDNTYDGVRYPDIIGALRIEQAWGSGQLSAVLHNTRVTGFSGDAIDLWGYGLLAGATFNLPALGTGDKVAAQGVYSHAALGYSGISNTALSPGDQGFNLNGNGVIFPLIDALNYQAGAWSTPTAWTAAAFFEHHFSPQWSLSPEVSLASLRYGPDPAIISASAVSVLGGAVAHWDPVAHLDFQIGIMVQRTHQATPAAYAGPPAFRANSGGLASNLAITRDF
jgi:Porin subfamily